MMPAFKTEKDQVFTDWPSVGETLIDEKGKRTLIVTEVRPKDKLGRNVTGILQSGDPYSCDVRTLLIIWSRPN